MARDVLLLHDTFRARLRGYETLTGISALPLFRLCAGCSSQSAQNILSGVAKHTPQSLSHASRVAAFTNTPLDQIVVGVDMPRVPSQILVKIVSRVLVEAKDRGTRSWLLLLRQEIERRALVEGAHV